MSKLVTVPATTSRPVNNTEADVLLDSLRRARDSGSSAEIRAAEWALVIHFRSFAITRAHRFTSRGVDLDDHVQVANLGLVKAVRGWRPQPSGGFLQYAKPMVVGELKRYFRDQVPMVRLPRQLQEVGMVVAMARHDLGRICALTDQERRLLALRSFDDCTQEQIGEAFGVSQMQISRSLRNILIKLQQQLAPGSAADPYFPRRHHPVRVSRCQ